jgi:hypothetical protein
MFSLRTLRLAPFLTTFLGFAAGSQSQAFVIKTDFSLSQRSGSTSLIAQQGLQPTSESRFSSLISGLELGALPGLRKPVEASVRLDRRERLSGTLTVRNDKGETETIETPQTSYQLSAQVSPIDGLTLGAEGDLVDSPLSSRTVSLEFSRTFYEYGARPYARILSSISASPVDYYIDPKSLKQKQRPTQIESQRLRIGLDQIVSEEDRVLVEVDLRHQPADRPTAYGVQLSYARSLGPKVAAQISYITKQENRADELRNERGHFGIQSAEGKLSYEINYSTLVSLSYGLVVETEAATRLTPEQTIGSDLFEFFMRRGFKDIQVIGTIRYSATNTQQYSSSIGGGLQWEI